MNKNLFNLLILCLWVGTYYYHRQKNIPKQVSTPTRQHHFVQGPIKSKEHNRRPADQKKKSQNSKAKLERFPVKTIKTQTEKYLIVKGITGSFEAIKDQKEITSNKNFFFYKATKNDFENVVFDKDSDEYGLFSGEITVKGEVKKIIELAQKYDLEMIYKGKYDELFILKTNKREFIEEDLNLFSNEVGVDSVKLDVSFSRKT
jgi:hypothetical protein